MSFHGFGMNLPLVLEQISFVDEFSEKPERISEGFEATLNFLEFLVLTCFNPKDAWQLGLFLSGKAEERRAMPG